MSASPLAPLALVVGAGTMGAGMAQVALQGGWRVALWDQAPGAAAAAASRLAKGLAQAEAKGKLPPGGAEAALARLGLPDAWEEVAPEASLALEAIVEDLGVKQALFAALDEALPAEAILASNTSALSLAAIAQAARRHPERVLGLHFFNPAPVMALVELVAPASASLEALAKAEALAQGWGKRVVRVADTPGFVVNRVARPYYGEALRLAFEGLASPDAIDEALQLAGFRMGPCALMDLIGLDVNLAVTKAVDEAFFGEARYRPHPLQAQLVAAGRLGRKALQGFYRYEAGGQRLDAPPTKDFEPGPLPRQVAVLGSPEARAQWGEALARLGVALAPLEPGADGLIAVGPLGAQALGQVWGERGPWPWALVVDPLRPATQWRGLLGAQVAVAITHDWGLKAGWEGAEWAGALGNPPEAEGQMRALMEALAGRPLPRVEDAVGLVVPRTLASLINEACFAAQQGVASPAAIDEAMGLGANHPEGPMAWGDRLGARQVLSLLLALGPEHGPERYRPALWLRRRGEAELPLKA